MCYPKFLITPTLLSNNGPVWIYFSDTHLFDKPDFLRSRFLENVMSKKSGVFGNPNF